MNSSVTAVIKIFLIIFILTAATIGLLGLIDVLDPEATKNLIGKASLAIGILGIASISVTMLSASKDSTPDP